MDRYSKIIFTRNIKVSRIELGLTQHEFAEKIGVTPSYVSDMEKGKAFPSPKRLEIIVNTFGIRREFLEYGEGELFDSGSKKE